jgi:hypothetical protein
VVAPRCQEIRDSANSNAAVLQAGYGVAATDIGALQTAIDIYRPLISKPREAVAGRKEDRLSSPND